jgi:hypothetical protein
VRRHKLIDEGAPVPSFYVNGFKSSPVLERRGDCMAREDPTKCKHCNKNEGEHLAKTMECPTGLKTRIGYLSFGPNVFEPKGEVK